MREFEEIVSGNAAWDESIQKLNPSFLPELAQGQHPLCLWFGCSDSRVPPDTICGAMPGTLFVHRNIANLTSDTDPSFLAVLQYAVEALQVPHIAVCGHTNCGGLGRCSMSWSLGTSGGGSCPCARFSSEIAGSSR
jgi:carbonic anhydrase